MNRLISILCFFFCSILVFVSCKQKSESVSTDISTGVYLKEVHNMASDSLNYRIFYPENFNPQKKYPVLLFLHGAGERGSDNEAQLVHGSELIAKGMNTHQAIAIFPQCPKDDYWVRLMESENLETGQRDFVINVNGLPSDAMQGVIDLLDKTMKNSYVDKSRIYVTGLSMGGMGTFDLLWRKHDVFAAGMPICGAGAIEKANLIAKNPVRIYHGIDDKVVAVQESLQMADAINRAGGDVKTYFYEGVNHDSWTNAFAEPDFLSWLFKQQKQ